MTATSSIVLESGDHLSRDDFHRRYCAHPEIKKAELVEGVVYVGSPVRVDLHGELHLDLAHWLATYRDRTPGVRVADNSTVLLDDQNELQPDLMAWRDEPDGPHINEDHYLEGAPQLVIEIAASSASYDLHEKLRAYERNGVREYVVWRTVDDAIDWFRWRDGRFVRVAQDKQGVIESEVFPGLRLNIPKLLTGDMRGVLEELENPPAAGA
jgi:Uma2 family endonuclease